jgi:hypothetical protein
MVAVFPPEVIIGNEVSVDGTVTVVVPPEEVRTDETTVDGATSTVVVPELEVTTTTELTEAMLDWLTNDETGTGTLTTEPPSVVICSVTYGVD